ncbi:methanogen output domain 1-containing protein [Streptomyces sp. NPDC050264]|uniref:methanogen output domain 1-containing protein n=1 Tax=Streptomyces sp. NPDC050264 TaxID=3155038 RepID=UPI00343CF678
MRSLIREPARVLEDVVGSEEAAGYVSLVSQTVGDDINRQYTKALSVDRLDRGQVAKVMVDLKKRLDGAFFVIEENDQRIVLGNRVCPFGEKVVGRPSMCMMKSNAFGTITAENLGYARVELDKTIARWDVGCRVVVHLRPPSEPGQDAGREYYGEFCERLPPSGPPGKSHMVRPSVLRQRRSSTSR